MTDDSESAADAAESPTLDEAVEQFLNDVDAAHDDYDRGYTDADATLSVVMNHVETLRLAHSDEE